ncbi:hypothetical protein [Hyphomicrobium sp. LHD-15]|uniref:hypothetical protein n=1 Tax=Hyphomicrobium sp. LHD-15 TaxID=3072142 RepID=UPI00280CAC1E|nr:hypothetical protein [Hyphomicrobium sp. LHD-15]MDQ8697995.1 hypothetical protein [Hyphomicrobium sp. LHD-15]
MSKIIRHLLVILTALPIFLGLATAGFAAPCTHEISQPGTGSHELGAPDQSTCPCCEKMLPAASATCGLACHTGIVASANKVRRELTPYRIKFALLAQSGHGIDLQPPLPPPR